MNDLQMTRRGDLLITGYDIVATDSIEQAILIKLRWFFGEWIYNTELGVQWFEKVLVKNPNKLLIRRMIEDAVLSVDGVKSVSNVTLSLNNATRKATIGLGVVTTQGKQDVMETIGLTVEKDEITAYVVNGRLVIDSPEALFYVVGGTLVFSEHANVKVEDGRLVIGGMDE